MPIVNCSVDTANAKVAHTWLTSAPVGNMWQGLTDARALPHWLGTLTSGEFTADEVVTIKRAEGYSCTSRITECAPITLLGMTWKFPDEEQSHLRITLNPVGIRTALKLEHSELGDEAVNYLQGWHTHLLYLEALLLGRPLPMDEFWSTFDVMAKP